MERDVRNFLGAPTAPPFAAEEICTTGAAIAARSWIWWRMRDWPTFFRSVGAEVCTKIVFRSFVVFVEV